MTEWGALVCLQIFRLTRTALSIALLHRFVIAATRAYRSSQGFPIIVFLVATGVIVQVADAANGVWSTLLTRVMQRMHSINDLT